MIDPLMDCLRTILLDMEIPVRKLISIYNILKKLNNAYFDIHLFFMLFFLITLFIKV